MKRFMIFVRLLILHCRKIRISNTLVLTQVKLENAIIPIIQDTQRRYFSNLFDAFKMITEKISPRSIAQLAPFLDTDNIIRVGGQINHAMVLSGTKHPILFYQKLVL